MEVSPSTEPSKIRKLEDCVVKVVIFFKPAFKMKAFSWLKHHVELAVGNTHLTQKVYRLLYNLYTIQELCFLLIFIFLMTTNRAVLILRFVFGKI